MLAGGKEVRYEPTRPRRWSPTPNWGNPRDARSGRALFSGTWIPRERTASMLPTPIVWIGPAAGRDFFPLARGDTSDRWKPPSLLATSYRGPYVITLCI